jgi:GNAT superfamily N-acetyltransferase
MSKPLPLTFHPLTPERWNDFERLFGPRGACGGCWCMFWKLRGRAFEENTGEAARRMQKLNVEAGVVPGLLAYADDQPVGWIAIEPRSAYVRLAHARSLKPVDDQPVWSVTCFFVQRKSRRQGVTVALLRAAIDYVHERDGKIIEGYPVDTKINMPAPLVYTGTASAFHQAGFKEVARHTASRSIFRYIIGD